MASDYLHNVLVGFCFTIYQDDPSAVVDRRKPNDGTLDLLPRGDRAGRAFG
jgi:hypothetical protein